MIYLRDFLLHHNVDISKFKAEISNPRASEVYCNYIDWRTHVKPKNALTCCFTWSKAKYQPSISWRTLHYTWETLVANLVPATINLDLNTQIFTKLPKAPNAH